MGAVPRTAHCISAFDADIAVMSDSATPYFWQRTPRWLRRLGAGSAVAAAVIVAIVGGLSFLAQRLAGGSHGERYSVTMHALAMVAVAGLSVAVATGLTRRGLALLGGAVLVATVVGPMTVTAVPLTPDLVNQTTWGDTVGWWHGVVGSALLAVLIGWTWWTVRCVGARGVDEAEATSSSRLFVCAVFAVVAVAGMLAYSEVAAQSDEPAMRAVLGWALLAAGMASVAASSHTAWPSLGFFLAAGGVLLVIVAAYTRIGGWPGVAGWELDGMESPIITSVASTAVVLLAPIVGAVVWFVRRRLAHGPAVTPDHQVEALVG
jgi:hypothetical protein